MQERLDLIGAITAHVIFISSIITFTARLLLRTAPGHWLGIPILLMAFPLFYLLLRATEFNRPILYYIQIGAMLLWLVLLFLADYLPGYDFRQTRWMVIVFVVLYFAGLGGMIGISALAGKGWMISAVLLFIVTGILTFVQRAVTGF